MTSPKYRIGHVSRTYRSGTAERRYITQPGVWKGARAGNTARRHSIGSRPGTWNRSAQLSIRSAPTSLSWPWRDHSSWSNGSGSTRASRAQKAGPIANPVGCSLNSRRPPAWPAGDQRRRGPWPAGTPDRCDVGIAGHALREPVASPLSLSSVRRSRRGPYGAAYMMPRTAKPMSARARGRSQSTS